MDNAIPLNDFVEIALVVQDMEKSLDAWCDLFGVARPEVRITKAELRLNEKYRGEPASYGGKFAMIRIPDRGLVIELHEPDANPSTFREFYDKHGNGVHHLGFHVGEARDAVVVELERSGFPVRNIGVGKLGTWTIIDGESALGVNLNVSTSRSWRPGADDSGVSDQTYPTAP